MKVERESVTKTRFMVEGDMTNSRVTADVIDDKARPIVLTLYDDLLAAEKFALSVRFAEAIVAVLTAAIPEAQAVTEKDDD